MITTIIICSSATVLVICLAAISMLVNFRKEVSEADFRSDRALSDASDTADAFRCATRAFSAFRTAVSTYPEDVSPATHDLLRMCLSAPCKKDAPWDTFREILEADMKRGVCKRVFDAEAEEPPK